MKKKYLELYLIPLVLLLLFPLWSNPGIFWDGWATQLLIERKQFQSIFDQWIENGRPLTAYLFYIFRYIDNPSTFSLILCNLGIAFTAYIIYRIVSDFQIANPKQAFFISVIGSIHPAYEISLAMPAVFYILSIPAFYMSGYIAIKSCLVSGFSKYIYIFFQQY